MSLIDTIKEIVRNYLSNENLGDVVYGTIVQTSPFAVKIEQTQILLSAPFLVVPQHLKTYEQKVSCLGEEYTVSMETLLKAGDKVILLKKHGGQLYVLLGKED